jgi:ribonuclease P protein component
VIARVFRVTTDRDIKRVLKLGRKFNVPEFSLYTLQNILKHPRMCVVVAGGVSKKAVVRNRLKRQVRAVLRAAIQSGKISYTVDIVVMVRAPFVKVADELRTQLVENFLINIGLMRK